MHFQLTAPFIPTGDQPQAIDSLVTGIQKGFSSQVLLGVTGSGKTFTMAKTIEKLNKPTLIISHNKTLAAQLYQEFRSFFPHNAVSFFVSYYDFYQPEAYIPRTDTYIEKETEVNEEIDKLRLAATTNLLTRSDSLIVASVSCIYNIGSPKEYGHFILELKEGVRVGRDTIMKRLVELQYSREKYDFKRGTFRVRGDTIDVFLAYTDSAVRVVVDNEKVREISEIDPLTGKIIQSVAGTVIYPAKHYMTNPKEHTEVFAQIQNDLEIRVAELKRDGRPVEAHRLTQKVNFDLEMIREVGYVNGIENYSRYFDKRLPGEAPYTLLDYFKEPFGNDWLLFIDESHMTIPQIRGMYNGDQARKQTLVDFGFRLPAALDNRPLTYAEFTKRIPQTIYVSATPNVWEISLAKEEGQRHTKGKYTGIAEQLVRPTGIVDPSIFVRPTQGQLFDLVTEIIKRKKAKERVLVTTLTKRTAEDLAQYLNDRRYREENEWKDLKDDEYPRVAYLHSDIVTLERSDILDDLRLGKYDVLIGINLLREGLDLPEVSLVAILDADKEGFLRSETSLIQTMGRAARHIKGCVIMYADGVTGSMRAAIAEIERRRKLQLLYNKTHHITPEQIEKPVREKLVEKTEENGEEEIYKSGKIKKREYEKLLTIDSDALTPQDKTRLIKKLESEMRKVAGELNFELAAHIRDRIKVLKEEI